MALQRGVLSVLLRGAEIPGMPIYRQALRRSAKLADLYDATTEKFCKVLVLRQPLPSDSPAISWTNSPYSETRFLNISSLEERFRELKVTGEMRLSILAEMCQLVGSAEYLRQQKKSVDTVTSTQLFHIKTGYGYGRRIWFPVFIISFLPSQHFCNF